MGTNEKPPMKYATDVNDNAEINTGGADDRTRITGDSDHDPDITGKQFSKHDTLTYGDRDPSGRLVSSDNPREPALDQGMDADQAQGGRGDAGRGPTTNPH